MWWCVYKSCGGLPACLAVTGVTISVMVLRVVDPMFWDSGVFNRGFYCHRHLLRPTSPLPPMSIQYSTHKLPGEKSLSRFAVTPPFPPFLSTKLIGYYCVVVVDSYKQMVTDGVMFLLGLYVCLMTTWLTGESSIRQLMEGTCQ